MSAVAIILANSEFILAFFLKIKIHKSEITNFVTLFDHTYIVALREKLKNRISS